MVKGRISGRSLLHIIHWSCIRGIGRTSHRSLCVGKQVGSFIVNDQNYINWSKRVAIYTFSTEADISVQVNNEKKITNTEECYISSNINHWIYNFFPAEKLRTGRNGPSGWLWSASASCWPPSPPGTSLARPRGGSLSRSYDTRWRREWKCVQCCTLCFVIQRLFWYKCYGMTKEPTQFVSCTTENG